MDLLCAECLNRLLSSIDTYSDVLGILHAAIENGRPDDVIQWGSLRHHQCDHPKRLDCISTVHQTSSM